MHVWKCLFSVRVWVTLSSLFLSSSVKENLHLHEFTSIHVCVFKLPPAIISILVGLQDLNETELHFHYFPVMVIFMCPVSPQEPILWWQVFVFVCVESDVPAASPSCQQ